ncbi:SDR family oxidoreductase [Lysobacter sp. CFH 32150]|uniref:SDR family oxidoreductase n=1 Tax=Lysobacter sp. CFH 32150 TaxID=2927128 RepID=UPI001FA7F220|nr:SDR family oxidoreductase [Lysobacter sp. CFH 32150]MCI4569094.1 SDR family oxidoreductase [Lysobacter sp. CFH 32150]
MSRRSLVTGANRGLGLEFVRQLLARGDRVIAACRHPGKATALNSLAGEHPGRLHVLPLDVADEKSRTAFAHELPLVIADEKLDLLINNAGVLHSGERFGSVPATNLDDSLRTNASGPFLLTQALAPLLVDGARIANLSSTMGSIASRTEFRSPSYCISKAAQNMATVMLAKALAPRGIGVIALHPGWVQTEMGGESAQTSPAQAVAGLLRVIDAFPLEQSGQFLDWQGEVMPW